MKLPGLIDPHVHLRDLGQSDKEDFYTGTTAALAGGYTTILDMPNNLDPIVSLDKIKNKIQTARDKIVCDTGFHFGSNGDNLDEFEQASNLAIGLKLFLNETTGNYLLNEEKLEEIFKKWPKNKVILFHAEEEKIDTVINVLKKIPRNIHICHISTASEIEKIKLAKEQHLPITCGVTPHHLFLTDQDLPYLKGFAYMKPFLKSITDQMHLWANLNAIDCIESDHAPHTLKEKQSQHPPYGVPGLETTLPLLITAMHQDKISIDQIIEKCHTNPAKIFNLKVDQNTFIDIDPNEKYDLKNENLFTKCKWTPFNGWNVYGRILKTTIRGVTVYEKNKITVTPGFGKILYP